MRKLLLVAAVLAVTAAANPPTALAAWQNQPASVKYAAVDSVPAAIRAPK
jgi:hypothetical protein